MTLSNSGEMTTRPLIPFSNYSKEFNKRLIKMLYLEISCTKTTFKGFSSFLNLCFKATISIIVGKLSFKSAVSFKTFVSLDSPSFDTVCGYKLKIDSKSSFESNIWEVISAFTCWPNATGKSNGSISFIISSKKYSVVKREAESTFLVFYSSAG